MKKKKILLTGGSGILGTEIKKFIPYVIAPNIKELDITSLKKCQGLIKKYDPDIIIHCAAFTDVAGAEKNKKKCWDVNVTGTQNIAKVFFASSNSVGQRRLVYISTDYVFDGDKGSYKEDDTPNPVNFYALTKLAGELIVKQYRNTLIIRTAFKPNGAWPYPKAFIDQYSSHEFVSEIAPDIVKASLMLSLTGTVHIAGKRKRVYDLARRASKNVGKISIKDVGVPLPRDTSLDSSKWRAIVRKNKNK